MFKVDHNANVNGTSLKGHITCEYAYIVKKFGQPLDGDDYKVSGEWHFTDDKGNAFTLYDWKSTELYDSGLPSVEQFRAKKQATFNVGASVDATDFIDWLKTEL
jgi:hypothetical protein